MLSFRQSLLCIVAFALLGCGPQVTTQPDAGTGEVPDAGNACIDACVDGAHRCGANGPEVCARTNGCWGWQASAACGASEKCFEGACVNCAGASGTFSAQPFDSQGETRRYFAHVPSTYQCDAAPWALWVDFHGTGGGDSDAPVEEYYVTQPFIDLADAEHFILVRPRSRSKVVDASHVFQWDINPGDLSKNVVYARALIADFRARYHVDPKRIYVSGFSNGTNLAAQFLSDAPTLAHGVAVHAGGLWDKPVRGAFGADAPRVYASTGFRDYMHAYQAQLVRYLEERSFPMANLWQREGDIGHDLYSWQLAETWRWFEQGDRPAAQALAAGWVKESVQTGQSLLQLASLPTGERFAAATGGLLFRRGADGVWSTVANFTQGPNFTDLCFTADGRGVVVGEGEVASTANNGLTWTLEPRAAEFGAMNFGFSYLNAVGCQGTRVTGGGYWTGVTRMGNAAWAAAGFASQFDYPSQVAAVVPGPSGRWVATGYNTYVGASDDGVAFTPLSVKGADWFTDAAAAAGGLWVVVGDHGTILRSTDDAKSFAPVPKPGTEDLYAVEFADASLGMAVGAHGTALLTRDGGLTWTVVSTGLDAMLSDVSWLDAHTALVVGEAGLALRYSVP
ncbi:MAG: hypothetical protein K1X64_21345 [Myxococcaceae bacterium]|nr:hypothetical protein [Myxococcaceae bacterium]